MQKQVSKQSLAIIALSILLAIAMALTVTFAAFSSSHAASGTVTFSGNVITTMSLADTYVGEGKAVTAFVPVAGTTVEGTEITFAQVSNATEAAALVEALQNITVGLTSASSNATFIVKASSSDAVGATGLTITAKNAVDGWTKGTGTFKKAMVAGNNVTLGTLYDIAFDISNMSNAAVTSDATITVKIYADTVASEVTDAKVA